ncbi:protein of unknown function [Candidatus Hydrogenisulfobacillus filiaventi]|uniref:EAL domain-containing protein n=1 Tax=Candidatus Hydrogenisulfobacillus filiaventi TaxID=2707344 RepID=A0A6F8ZCY5_9FIRM|nr:protein of unknown function [Candidatus Hydrogenisulfobacillus filiaventi]
MDAVQRLWSAWEEPAVLVDPDGRILTANGAFRRWAGKPWPQLVGQGLPELPPGAGSVPVEVGGRLAAYWLHLPGVRLPGETAQGLPGWVVTPGFTRDRRWAVAPVFQPIVALPGGEVLGYEALSRPSWEGRPVDPETLFHAAAAAGTTLEADLACFAAVARAVLAAPWPAGALLFVNVSPRSLMTPDRLHPVLDPLVAALPPGRVVLEISEHVPEDIPYSLWEELPRVYPGVQWAQDDYGLGNADPSRMLAVRPQWLKLDRTLMLQALADAAGRTWLRRFAAWA